MTWAKGRGRKKRRPKRSKRMDIEGENSAGGSLPSQSLYKSNGHTNHWTQLCSHNYKSYIYICIGGFLLYSRSFLILISLRFLSSSFGSWGNNNETHAYISYRTIYAKTPYSNNKGIFFFSRREWHYKQKGMSC
jgi:hypothetical protein